MKMTKRLITFAKHYIWFFIAGQCLGENEFPFARNISCYLPSTPNYVSCRGRCSEGTTRSLFLECKCDHACMFLGDCCYDYLIECDPRELNFSAALLHQYSIFHRFKQHSDCTYFHIKGNEPHSYRIVNSCPNSSDKQSVIELMCSAENGKRSISTYMPVESNGVLYLNIYCAACHGLALHQLRHVVQGFGCTSSSPGQIDPDWLPFDMDVRCLENRLNIKPSFNDLKRYRDTCMCSYQMPDRSCTDDTYHKECNAYANVIFDSTGKPYNNFACRACDDDGFAKAYFPNVCNSTDNLHWYNPSFGFVKLFDFTGISLSMQLESCAHFYNEGYSGNPCLVMHCQDGFSVHGNRCISLVAAQSCYSPRQNRYDHDYLIANLFQSALVLHYKDTPSSVIFFPRQEILENSVPCSYLPALYNKFLPQDLPDSVQCAVVYFDYIAFAKLSVELNIKNVVANLFPQLQVLHTILLNHDPVSGISCTTGTTLELINQFLVVEEDTLEVRSQRTRQLFTSNKDPLVLVHKPGESDLKIWAIVCDLPINDPNCSAGLYEDASLPIDICLKYVLTDNISMEGNTVQLNSGKQLKHGQFMRSANGNILVCVDLYEELHNIPSNKLMIVVCVAYSVSSACLLATFIIHIRYVALRTLPGLMIMNLIIALFFAQLFFLLNTFGVFQAEPIMCQVMATSQHYFWLASFAWMACMSLDIFLCLSPSCTTVNTYSASKYRKYVLAGWLVPLSIPLITNILTHATDSTLGYDTSVSCWLSNSQGVLYLFAIPVFTIVCANILLFIGSVYRLCALLKNASFVGRKEDKKQRLAQCIKLSSWMGISWIIGIMPNFVDVEALWFVFAAANALQGVHIFVAFGVTGKARVLMHKDSRRNEGTRTAVSAIPSVMAEISVEQSEHNCSTMGMSSLKWTDAYFQKWLNAGVGACWTPCISHNHLHWYM